ncbi:exonuclease RecJ [Halorubellus sp. JP-L1]|uniref:exonuclease RecJ n=1 Tax=Halorubellus sp. JP-L1 TaxID=2715753 RepID=UPI00140834EE|nr:exonuclease RecJ [Halorubellus sp. JP-L1]NHN40110.1 exonuclease RecJ [Halorubellus sp. JP-L1]
MSQSGPGGTDGGLDAASVAAEIADAPFVRVIARASGDAVAAAGLLGRVLASQGTPFQVSVGRTIEDRTRRVAEADDSSTAVVVGSSQATDAVHLDPDDEPASVAAWRLAGELGATADSVLALVGVAAAGVTPGAGSSARLVESAEAGGRLDRRPGVAGPVDDVVDVLVHSTLVHASFSGDEASARSALSTLGVDVDADVDASASADLSDDVQRRVASFVAVATTGASDAPARAGEAVERALRPYVLTDSDAPFATVVGYADVLSALASSAPGTGVAVALGHDVRDGALAAWREHSLAVHDAVASCERSRHDGVVVVRDVDAPLSTTARLVRDYRSPEPVVAAVDTDGDAVALAATPEFDVEDVLARVTTQTGGEYDGTADAGYATIDCDTDQFVTTLREEL